MAKLATKPKPSRGELLRLAKNLGVVLDEDEFSALLDRARAADDPEAFLAAYVNKSAATDAPGPEPVADDPDAPSDVPVPPPAAPTTAEATAASDGQGEQPATPRFRTPKYHPTAVLKLIEERWPKLDHDNVCALAATCKKLQHGDEQREAIDNYTPYQRDLDQEHQSRLAINAREFAAQRGNPGAAVVKPEGVNEVISSVALSRQELFLTLERLIVANLDRLPIGGYSIRGFSQRYFGPKEHALFFQLFGHDDRTIDKEVCREAERCRRLLEESTAAGTAADRQSARDRAARAAKDLSDRSPAIQRELDQLRAELDQLHQAADEAAQGAARREQALANLRAICVPAYVRDAAQAAGNEVPIQEYLARQIG